MNVLWNLGWLDSLAPLYEEASASGHALVTPFSCFCLSDSLLRAFVGYKSAGFYGGGTETGWKSETGRICWHILQYLRPMGMILGRGDGNKNGSGRAKEMSAKSETDIGEIMEFLAVVGACAIWGFIVFLVTNNGWPKK